MTTYTDLFDQIEVFGVEQPDCWLQTSDYIVDINLGGCIHIYTNNNGHPGRYLCECRSHRYIWFCEITVHEYMPDCSNPMVLAMLGTIIDNLTMYARYTRAKDI